MRTVGPWIAFLTMLFALVALCGLFASYAVEIPLDRALARSAMLDSLLVDPDPVTRLQALRPTLGTLEPALTAAGPLPNRIVAARAQALDEQQRETASLTYRVRLMLIVITIIAAALGAGIVSLAHRGRMTPT